MNDIWKREKIMIWITILTIPLLLSIFWITKNLNTTAMFGIPILIYMVFIWSPKILMFMIYNIILGLLIWYFVNEYWLPLISNTWNWLNKTLCVITYTGLTGFSLWSIFSCWDNKTLKETDIGHWTISGWLPDYHWAANLKNGPLGVFTGLPASMISLKVVDAIKYPIKKELPIQVEIYGDTLGRKFAAEFEISFDYEAVDTLKVLKTESSPNDLKKIFEKCLTDWLNNEDNKYTNIKELKLHILNIEKKVRESLGDAETIYGKKMSNPRIIDIQLPKNIIEQQNNEAEEITDLNGFIEQIKKLREELPNMTDKELSEQINIMRGNSKRVNISSTGNGRTITPIVP